MLSKLLLVAGLAMQAMASTHRINVGKDGLTFAPNSFNASVGDTLEFHFYAKNHSVVRGDFDNACNPAPDTTGGFFSGWFPTNGSAQNANVFTVTINDTQPIVYYCSQNTGSHCKNGMVGVVNPTISSSLQNYLGLAKAVSTDAKSPPAVFGGVIGPAPAEPSSTTGGGSGGTTTSETPAPSTSKPNAAGSVRASFAGLVAAAAFALYMS
ncbi:hypothetical protein GQ53DRAFT_801633 [Thozetella sp. PMI_491]|nr:hypothetical protein GQ53DRAFT_801633 [Thozetella sp. PMI_491]